MLAYVCHKSRCGRTKFNVIFGEEVVCLKGKFAVVIDICKSMTNGIPIYSCASGESVKVLYVVNVMYVEASETVVTNGADGILRLSAAKRYVTEVETNGKCLGIVERVIVAVKLSWVGAYTVTDVICNGSVLPHILDCDFNTAVFCIRSQGTIKFHIDLEHLLFTAKVGDLLNGMNDYILNAKQI